MEYKLRLQQQRRRRMLLTAGGLTLLLLLIFYGTLLVLTQQARWEANQLASQRQVLESHMPALEQYATLQAQVQKTATVIKQAVGVPPDWAGILTDTGRYIPQDVWITDFSAAYKPGSNTRKENAPADQAAPAEGSGQAAPGSRQNNAPAKPAPVVTGEITIRGYAIDRVSVARWLEEMRKVPGLNGITCQFVSEESLDGEPAARFEIKADIMQDAPQQNQAAKEGAVDE